MAFAPLYGFETNLTAATAPNVGLLQVDPNAASHVSVTLAGASSYCALSDGLNYEIVRIDGVSGSNLVVTRAQSGTGSFSFPQGACLRFVWTSEGIAAVASYGGITLTGSGALGAIQTGPNSWTLVVPTPTITSTAPIQIMGAYPAWEITSTQMNSGCCCGGNTGGGTTSGIQTVNGNGIVSTTTDTSGNTTISVTAPTFTGTGGITITGSWPAYTINYTGGSSSGGVTAISGSAKILVSGSPTTPTLSLATTGVGAGSFNGLTYDSYGTITAVNPTYVPITTLTSGNAGITIAGAGGANTVTLNQATISALGGVKLADSTPAATNNSSDNTSAVTPAGINSLLSSNLIASTTFSNSSALLAPATYSNVVPITVTVPGTSPVSVLITAIVSVVDSSSATIPPSFAIGVFNGASLVAGTPVLLSGQVQLQYKVSVSSPTTFALHTTALTGTQSVQAASLSIVTTQS